MIRDGLSLKQFVESSKLNFSGEWGTRVNSYFEQMSFDSVWNSEESFLGQPFEHSITIWIPMRERDAEHLRLKQQKMDVGHENPMLTRSLLLVIEKNYATDEEKRWTSCFSAASSSSSSDSSLNFTQELVHSYSPVLSPAKAQSILNECRGLLSRVSRCEVRHFFNLDDFDKKCAERELRQQDIGRHRGLALDQAILLSPIYVAKFEENNYAGMYVDVLGYIENVKCLVVDMLTLPLVQALTLTHRIERLEHAMLNTQDPRALRDVVAAVEESFLTGCNENLKLLHSSCSSAVLAALQNNLSFPNLIEVDVKQRGNESDFTNLVGGITQWPNSMMNLSTITLRDPGPSFHEFLTRVLGMVRKKASIHSLMLDVQQSTMLSRRQSQEFVRVARGFGCGNVKTCGLMINLHQVLQMRWIKVMARVSSLYLYVVGPDTDHEAQTVLEESLLDASKPGKLIWNMLPRLVTLKLFNRKNKIVNTYERN